MRAGYILFTEKLWKISLIMAILMAGCGTFEVGLEPTNGIQTAVVTPFLTPTLMPGTISPTPEPAETAGSAAILPEDTNDQENIFKLTGRAMTIDPPTGMVELIPEKETPFADANGAVRVRISEWARIVDTAGAIVQLDDFSRGIKLEMNLLFRDGELTSEEVIVLEPGVPPIEENPAYTDVTGLVTPLPSPTNPGDEAIRLFEVTGADGVVDPGSPLTVKWAFDGESASICVGVIPRPVTQTCFQELPPAGSMQVTVPDDAREAIIYSLYVQLDDLVASTDIRIPLSEGLGCPYPWYFESDAYLLECSTGESTAIRPQAQNYEKGLMLRLEESWLGSEPYIFAFIWDEERNEYGFTEGPIQDPWTAELPEQVVGEEAPTGLFRPNRGFGLLWNGQLTIPQMGEPRTMDGEGQVGWASGPVFEYDAQYQCAEEFFGNWNCYLSLPDGQIVGLPGRAP